jgi:ABC-type glycerol-3-phosphate transport system substrate-binding protein
MAGAIAGASLAGARSTSATEASSFAGKTLNVTYFGNVSPRKYLQQVLDGFKRDYGVTVNYSPESTVFGDIVQKLTTYMSSGYRGLDVLWIDDFITASFGTAEWLVPLEQHIPHDYFTAVPASSVRLGTYNNHIYRLPANIGLPIFYYRKDLFDKEGLSVPRTWNDIVHAGLRLTKGGRYGLGFAGKNGNTELFNELCYWMGQAGGDPLHMKTPAARTTLQFIHDMLHKYKILPPDTVAADYTSLLAAFQDGRFAMWPTFDGFLETFLSNTKFWSHSKVVVDVPPRGPANNSTFAGSWGWAVSKFSPQQDLALKFITYAASRQSERLLAFTGSQPARTALLSDPAVAKVLPQAPYVARYAREVDIRSRPITGQAQRLSDAIEQVINQYLNGQIALDTAITEAQQRINQIQQNA